MPSSSEVTSPESPVEKIAEKITEKKPIEKKLKLSQPPSEN